jgi:DNA-binding transcriptional LysR family regulator
MLRFWERWMTGQIERIRVFLEVAHRQSFAAAARTLDLSPSIATRYVSELEAELGVQLLVRTTRRVSLTVAGRLYLERIRPVVDEIDRTNEFVREQQDAVKGLLRVSAPLSLGLRFLPGAVARFCKLYPDVELKLNLTDRFVDMLGDEFDMALRISGPPSDKSTIWRKICVVPRLLVASPAYLLRAGVPKAPEDLTHHKCLGYSNFAGGDQWMLRDSVTGEEQSTQVKMPFECDNGEVVAELAASGEGVALLPRFIVSKYLEAETLAPVLAQWRPPEIWLTAFYPPYEALPAKVNAFTRLIEQVIAADRSMVSGG